MWFLGRDTALGSHRGAPATRHSAARAIRRLALAGMAMVTLGIEGCQSGGGCDSCGGGFGSGISSGLSRAGKSFQDTTSRIFNHKKKKGGDCCEGAAIEGAPVQGGGVFIEGAPGSIMPSAPPSAPSDSRTPSILEPAPRAGGLGSRGRTSPGSSSVDPLSIRNTGSQSTSLGLPRSNRGEARERPDELARAPSASERQGLAASLLDNLPPMADLPEEVARRSTFPVPPEADRLKGAAEPSPSPPPVPVATTTRTADLPPIKVEFDATATPGIKRFVSVRAKVSGGTLPSPTGLDWLKDKGIKTLIDLRVSTDVDPAFTAAVRARGFRYVSLPIDTARPEPAKIARFHDELGATESQPLYFFDDDGRRAGLVWYVHGLSYKTVDLATANRDATELGLTDRDTWLSAANYLDVVKRNKVESAPAAKPGAAPSADSGLPTLSSPLASWTRPTFSGSEANPPELAR